jgi:predicted ATPase
MQAELALQLAIGRASMPVLGYGSPEVGRAFEQAAEICRQVGTGTEKFVVIGGLFGYYLVRADHRRVDEFARELLEIASQEGDDALAVEAHFARGVNLCWQGKFKDSVEHLNLAMSSYRGEFTLVNIIGSDTPAFAYAYAATSLWLLGYPDRSIALCVSALRRAEEINHPFSAAATRLNTVMMRVLGKDSMALPEAEALIATSTEQGFSYAGSVGAGFRNCALLEENTTVRILAELSETIARLRMQGTMLSIPLMQAALAKGTGQMGETAEGLSIVAETLAEIEQTSEHMMEAEIHRIHGELIFSQDDLNIAEAQNCFQRAIEIARRQSAKSWELRATISLARLLDKQGKRAQARTMLADIYGWFTEGFDTADLKDAKTLLGELEG